MFSRHLAALTVLRINKLAPPKREALLTTLWRKFEQSQPEEELEKGERPVRPPEPVTLEQVDLLVGQKIKQMIPWMMAMVADAIQGILGNPEATLDHEGLVRILVDGIARLPTGDPFATDKFDRPFGVLSVGNPSSYIGADGKVHNGSAIACQGILHIMPGANAEEVPGAISGLVCESIVVQNILTPSGTANPYTAATNYSAGSVQFLGHDTDGTLKWFTANSSDCAP
jgi:hypothetical protein